MNNYFIVLRALFRNKLRFGEEATKTKRIALLAVLGFTYAVIMFALLYLIIELRALFADKLIAVLFYFFMLMTAALIVLIFGIINLISTLFLSKDTDFYSALPIRQSTVFAAKLSFVYLSEAAIVAVILLPLVITFGIVIKAWAMYYVISILTIAIVPALPLMLAAIIAVPIMYLASKLKNRSVVALIFYIALFTGGFAAYLYFVTSSSNVSEDGIIDENAIYAMLESVKIMLYALYPFSALSAATVGYPSFGLNLGASTAVNVLIFIGVSVALTVILLLLSHFMYSQSAKANNQTYNKTKKGEYKTASGLSALMKREYIASLRTTQVAFQCYAVFILPIVFSIMFGLTFRNFSGMIGGAGDNKFPLFLTFGTLLAMLITVNNGAATTFSREGTAFAGLKTLPVTARSLLKAKILAWLVFAVPVTVISVVIANVINFDLDFFLLSVFSFVPLSAEFVIFGALWDLKSPKLKWTDPKQAIKHNAHTTIGQVFGIVSGFLLLAVLVVLLINGVDISVISTVYWIYIYAIVVAFGIANILLYRKADIFYNRIEI